MIFSLLRKALLLTALLLAMAVPVLGEPRTLVITDELQLGLADSFMAEGEYYRAITEYKKFLYFFPDADQTAYVQLQIGMAYYHGGECAQAIKIFATVRQHYPSEQFSTAAFYEGVCRNRLKDPQLARDNFERVVASDPGANQSADALAGVSLTALDLGDWAGSRQALERLAGGYPETSQGKAAQDALPLVKDAEVRPRKSLLAAGAMSAIVPGSGYIYTERYRDGLMSFLVNGLFIAGTVVAIDHENYPAAALIGGAGLPFYLGNIYGSANAANKWNMNIALELRKELALRLNFNF